MLTQTHVAMTVAWFLCWGLGKERVAAELGQIRFVPAPSPGTLLAFS